MTNLTEQWKKGKLEEYKKYYCKTKWFEDVFQARCYNKDTEDEWWVLENEKYVYNSIYHTEDIEVLAPVPSYEEYEQLENWNRFTADYHALREAKEIAEYEKVELLEKVKQLKELLKEIRQQITTQVFGSPKLQLFGGTFDNKLLSKIDEVLK